MVIVVGVTGLVGREMLKILADLGVQNIAGAASARSAGQKIPYAGREITVQNIESVDFSQYKIALFSAGSAVSQRFAPKAVAASTTVIDNTSFFRMQPDVPLVVPEINAAAIGASRLIANPNCSTIQMVMALKPLHDLFEATELIISTYQAAGGAGQKGIDELNAQLAAVRAGKPVLCSHFRRQLAFNVIPQIDDFAAGSYTKEELKMINETQKILGAKLAITVTCVRVPVVRGHAVSVCAKFKRPVDIRAAREALENFPGVKIVDNPANYEYATPLDCAGGNDVLVSRLRQYGSNGLNFWCVADNIRKGAALNAIQIAQLAVGSPLFYGPAAPLS